MSRLPGPQRARLSRLRKKQRLTPKEKAELAELEARQRSPAAIEPEAEAPPSSSRITVEPPDNAKVDAVLAGASTWSPAGDPQAAPAAASAPTDESPPASSDAPAAPSDSASTPSSALSGEQPESAAPAPDPEAVARGAEVIAEVIAGFVSSSMLKAVELADSGDLPQLGAELLGKLREPSKRAAIHSIVAGAARACAIRYGGGSMMFVDEAVVTVALGGSVVIQMAHARMVKERKGLAGGGSPSLQSVP